MRARTARQAGPVSRSCRGPEKRSAERVMKSGSIDATLDEALVIYFVLASHYSSRKISRGQHTNATKAEASAAQTMTLL